MSHPLNFCLFFPSRRVFSTTFVRKAFTPGPAPPRLPPKEQEEFERLQRNSAGAFSAKNPSAMINQSQVSTTKTPPKTNQSPLSQSEKNGSPVLVEETGTTRVNARVRATGTGEELHPDIQRGAKPEFEGDVNPVTGEVGGPKNEPLRWGSTGERGDWSYNGRVTDF